MIDFCHHVAGDGGCAEGRLQGHLWCRRAIRYEVIRHDDRRANCRNPVVIVQGGPTDPLSDVLVMVQATAACSIRFQTGGEWALRFEPAYVKFDVVRSGGCWLWQAARRRA
ncbi:cupin domain-containing protein [Croceibacterium ferulae]|uniref:cupin domain-containing protein n=1 Tax=Croceibacterium ferulae TaxID=1854641 RepID=UPI003BA951AE